MSLGSFAKKKYTFVYNPDAAHEDDKEKIYPQSNPYQYVWFNISKYVSDCMVEIKKYCANKLIFFWVDAVFVENDPVIIKGIYSIIEKYGFGHKTNDINKIEYKSSGEIHVSDNKHDDARVFNTPKSENSIIKLISELNNYKHEPVICFE